MLNTPPRISIVTPSYNQGEFLEETILSVLEQNYPNLEYVIIDGGSTDNSVEIIEKYASHLHYWVSEKDHGHGHALNKGFQRTSGEIMAWLNSDDMYMPWTFRTVAEIFTSFHNVQWLVGFNAWWNDKGALLTAHRVPKNIYDFLAGDYAWIQQESTFWTRKLWQPCGGYINEDYAFMVDGELWTRFFLQEKLFMVDAILGGYRSHSKNRAKLNYPQCCAEMQKAIKTMAVKCDKEIHHNDKALIRLKNIKKIHLLNKATIGLFRRWFPALFTEIDYDLIVYKNGAWNLQKQDFLPL